MFKFLLVGRPNVGKSTLFNAVTATRCRAIVYDIPGVTRDCNYAPARLGSTRFTIIDTPGLVYGKINTPVKDSIADADLIGFMVDGKVGVVSGDLDLAKFVRSTGKSVILLVNKCENPIILDKQYYNLGFGDPICISSAHKTGFDEMESVLQGFFNSSDQNEEQAGLDIAIVGRPNTGKSTLINALLKKERLEVSEVAGTTRDSISVQFDYQDRRICLLDTAGMRKKTRILDVIEKFSASSSIESIKKAKIVVLIINADESLQRQDANILHLVKAHKKGIVVGINKIDLVPHLNKVKDDVEHEINRIISAPIVYFSALKQNNINMILESCLSIDSKLSKVISTSKLNAWLKIALKQRPPSRDPFGRALKIKYCVCIRQNPMLIRMFCNLKDAVDAQYNSYLSNSFRKHFDATGVPIEFLYSTTANPYATKSNN